MTDWWFTPSTLDSSTNKTDCHNIAKILLKVVLNTITLTHMIMWFIIYMLQGAIAIAGASVKWLRDNLGIIKTAAEVG